MAVSDMLFVGIRGSVVALDRATGVELWRTSLKAHDFVNVLVEDDAVYASARGEVFRLDASTGSVLWKNPLKGLGWGIVTLATSGSSPGNRGAGAAHRKKQDAAAGAS